MKRKHLPLPLKVDGSHIYSAEHVLTVDGKHYDMARAYRYLARRKPVWVRLSSLSWFGKMTTVKGGFSWRRLRTTNTRYPLIISADGKILDGRHRFVKMMRAGRVRALAHFLTTAELQRFRCRKYKGKLVK